MVAGTQTVFLLPWVAYFREVIVGIIGRWYPRVAGLDGKFNYKNRNLVGDPGFSYSAGQVSRGQEIRNHGDFA